MPPFFTHSFFSNLLAAHQPQSYAVVFLGMIFEGDVTLFAAAFLTQLGFFDFFDILLTVLAGVAVGDSLWYWLGFALRDSSFFLVRLAGKVIKPFDKHIEENNFRTILIAKFTYGTNHLMLIRNGMLAVPYKKYLKNDLLAALIWVAAIGSLGYIFGASYVLVRHYLRFVEVGLLLVIIIFLLFDRIVGQNLRKKL